MNRSDARSCRERAAIVTGLAEQAVCEAAKAKLVYLGEMWLVAAKIAELVETNKSHRARGGEPRLLLLE
jgi:hypothetical protein